MPNFSKDKLTHVITSFRVTEEEYQFIDGLAKSAGLGGKTHKGHSMVVRKAIAALMREVEREEKRAKAKQKESNE